MKQIILITNSFPYGINEQSFIYPELKELIKEFQLNIVTANTNDELVIELPEDIKIFRYDAHKNYNIPLLLVKSVLCSEMYKEIYQCAAKRKISLKVLFDIVRTMMRTLHFEKYLKTVRKTINSNGAIYYSYWNNYTTFAATRIATNNDRVISRIHRADLYMNGQKSWQEFKNITNDKVDLLFFISEQGRQYYKKNFKNLGERLKLCYLGVKEQDGLNPFKEKKELNILSFSYLSEVKRINLIIDVISGLDDINVNWTHIGGGKLEEEIKNYADIKLKDKQNVIYKFTGYMDNEEALNYVKQNEFDFLLNTSFSEGLPVTMMEAMSLGIPVIGTDVGGVREIIEDGYNGFLVDRDFEIKDLINIILKYYELTFDQKQRLRENAYTKWKEKFYDSKNHMEFVEIIENLCKNQGKD